MIKCDVKNCDEVGGEFMLLLLPVGRRGWWWWAAAVFFFPTFFSENKFFLPLSLLCDVVALFWPNIIFIFFPWLYIMRCSLSRAKTSSRMSTNGKSSKLHTKPNKSFTLSSSHTYQIQFNIFSHYTLSSKPPETHRNVQQNHKTPRKKMPNKTKNAQKCPTKPHQNSNITTPTLLPQNYHSNITTPTLPTRNILKQFILCQQQ